MVGGGHNGLTHGAYLAKAGLKTLILERRHLVGGAAITEELMPGFNFTTFSYALSLLRPDIIHELNLVEHGFMPLLMPNSFAPKEDGDYLLLTMDRDENLREIMRHSAHDADAMDRYEYDMERVCQLVKPLFDRVPPNPWGTTAADADNVAWLLKHLGSAPQKVAHDLVRLLTGSAADFLDDYFESDIIKGYMASSAIIGTKVGPMSQGSGLVLLFHSMGEHDSHFGAWAFHKGGNGGFTQVLSRAAQAFGAEILLDADVDRVITKNGRAVGVALTDGTEIKAKAVTSALDPRRTFTQLVDPRELPTELVDAINRYRFQGTSSKVNFALDGTPHFPALGDRFDQYRGFTNLGPSMEYLERAFDDAKYGWFSQRPYLDCAVQSVVDPDMAPPGQARHVLLRPVHAVPPQEGRRHPRRLGRRAAEPRRHRAADAGVVLPRLLRPGAAPRGGHAARHRAGRRPDRGQHLPRGVPGAADVLLPAGARLQRLPHPAGRLLPVRLGHPPGRLRDGRPGQARQPAGARRPGRPQALTGLVTPCCPLYPSAAAPG